MRTNYVLIDFENVHVKSLELLKGENFRVIVFLGPMNKKLPVDLVLAMQVFAERAEYVLLEAHGANALDFHVAFHLGRLVAEDPAGFFHIISKDTGFDPLVQHLKARKVFSARSASIEDMACFPAASSVALPPKPASPAKSSAAIAALPLNDLCAAAITHLRGMKAAKPAKTSTLNSTLQMKLGKTVPPSTIAKVCSELARPHQGKWASRDLCAAPNVTHRRLNPSSWRNAQDLPAF